MILTNAQLWCGLLIVGGRLCVVGAGCILEISILCTQFSYKTNYSKNSPLKKDLKWRKEKRKKWTLKIKKTPCHSLFTSTSFLSFSLIYSSHSFSNVSLLPKLSFPELRLLFSLMAHSSLHCVIECHLSHFNTNSLVKSNLTSS